VSRDTTVIATATPYTDEAKYWEMYSYLVLLDQENTLDIWPTKSSFLEEFGEWSWRPYPHLLRRYNESMYTDLANSISYVVTRDSVGIGETSINIVSLPPTTEQARLQSEIDRRTYRGTALDMPIKANLESVLVAAGLRHDGDNLVPVKSKKIKYLKKWLARYPGEPLVVAAMYLSQLDVAESYADRPVFRLTGQNKGIREWNDCPDVLLLMQAETGSVGVDLSHSKHMLVLSLPWSYASWYQLSSRIISQGTEQGDLTVLLVEGTTDIAVYDSLCNKQDYVARYK